MAITKIKTTSSFTNLTKYDSFLAGNAAYSPAAYESIASASGTGSSGTITFSSIPSTYTSLQIRVIARDTSASGTATNISFRVGNGSIDTGANYARHSLFTDMTVPEVAANGAASGSAITMIGSVVGGGNTAGVHSVMVIDILDYASTTKYKTLRAYIGLPTGNTDSRVILQSGLWMSTSAINTIQLLDSTNFASSSTFALYGIKGA